MQRSLKWSLARQVDLQELLDEMARREPPRIPSDEEDRGTPVAQPEQAAEQEADLISESPAGEVAQEAPVPSEDLPVGETTDVAFDQLDVDDAAQPEIEPVESGFPSEMQQPQDSAEGGGDYSPETPEASPVSEYVQGDEEQAMPIMQPELVDGLDGTGESLGEPDQDDRQYEVEEPQPSPSYDLPVSRPTDPSINVQESPIGYFPQVTFNGSDSAEIPQATSFNYGSSRNESFKGAGESFDSGRFISDLGAELSPRFDELAYNLSANTKDFVNQRVLEITMLGDA